LDYSTLPGERRQAILRRLAEDGRVVAVALSREFGTSEDTIRRDLRDLASAGWCTRIYGGALSISPASTTLSEREAQVPAREAALARAAVAVVTHGDVVFIDAGSTNLAIARALPEREALTIVTNAPSIAAALVGRDGFDVLVIGGNRRRVTGALRRRRRCRSCGWKAGASVKRRSSGHPVGARSLRVRRDSWRPPLFAAVPHDRSRPFSKGDYVSGPAPLRRRTNPRIRNSRGVLRYSQNRGSLHPEP
jgi:hypothetical protein